MISRQCTPSPAAHLKAGAANDGASNGSAGHPLSASTIWKAEWVEAHEALSRLAHQRAAFDAEEGGSLLRALRSEAHRHLGYGSFFEYVERLFGYGPRTIDDKLRTAAALETLPVLSQSLAKATLIGRQCGSSLG